MTRRIWTAIAGALLLATGLAGSTLAEATPRRRCGAATRVWIAVRRRR
jgi:hypothetical protein